MIRFRSLKSPSELSPGELTAGALALLLATTAPAALGADNTNWQLHGAITQGLTYTSDNSFYGPSDDDVSLKFTEISLNASARLLPNLRASGQVAYRQAGAQGEKGDVDYLFLDYQFLTETPLIAGIRVGRYKLPIGLYNETRDVAFTRPSIFVPQSAYPDRARDLELSSDGALIYTDIFTDGGQWTLELDAGRPRLEKETVETSFQFVPGSVNLDRHRTYGGRLMYQSSDGRWIAALSRTEANVNYEILTPFIAFDIDVDFVYWLASLQCNIDQWSFTAEYGHMDMRLTSDYVTASLHPLQYYVQATRHLDRHWSVYTRYDNLYWDRRDRSGDTYGQSLNTDTFANFAHDYGFGVRYDINSNAMISGEYHYIDGTGWLSGLDTENASARYWDMVSVAFSYRF